MRIVGLTLLVYLACTSTSFGQNAYVLSAKTPEVRGTPEKDGKIIGKLPPGTPVTVMKRDGTWSLVQTEAFIGWVPSSTIQIVGKVELDPTPVPTPTPIRDREHLLPASMVQTASPSPAYSESEDAKPKVSPPIERPATSYDMKARTKSANVGGDLTFQWDKFKDETIVTTKPQNLVGSWESVASMMASTPLGSRSPSTPKLLMVSLSFGFPGQTLTETPQLFALVFNGMSPDWQLRGNGVLYFLYDDQRMELSAQALDRQVVRWNRVDESIAYIVTREQIQKLVNAVKVELRIGTSRPRELKVDQRRKWKTLLEVTQLETAK